MTRRSFKNAVLSIIFLFIISSCSNLKTGEIARVDYSFSGFFGSERNRLLLYKQSGSTFAKLETNGKVVRTVKLSTEQIATFNSFVEALSKLKEREGCTSVEEYALYTQSETIKKTDGGCGWNGFAGLERNIFETIEE